MSNYTIAYNILICKQTCIHINVLYINMTNYVMCICNTRMYNNGLTLVNNNGTLKLRAL